MAGGRRREWIRKKVTTVAGSGSELPRWTLRIRALSTALCHRRHRAGLPRVNLPQLFYENVVFYLLWVLESVVVLAKLCFFFLRFGFRL